MAQLDVPFSRIQETLKRVVSALDEAGVPFLIGGSLASWARGGPDTTHDLDVIIRPHDAKRAQQALVQVGIRGCVLLPARRARHRRQQRSRRGYSRSLSQPATAGGGEPSNSASAARRSRSSGCTSTWSRLKLR